MESGRLRIQFQRFGANFADRWPRWTGARLIEVHLHSKLFRGTLKWPLKGGSRLIEVTATAGLTVLFGIGNGAQFRPQNRVIKRPVWIAVGKSSSDKTNFSDFSTRLI